MYGTTHIDYIKAAISGLKTINLYIYIFIINVFSILQISLYLFYIAECYQPILNYTKFIR